MKSLLQIEIENKQRVLLVGPPGIAKTARLLAAAKANGMRVIVMRASLSERVDFGGCLVPDVQANVTKAGRTHAGNLPPIARTQADFGQSTSRSHSAIAW